MDQLDADGANVNPPEAIPARVPASEAFGLAGEIALVTGGSSGVGLAIARCLAEAGAKVVIAARRESAMKEAIEIIGHGSAWLAHDVTLLKMADRLVTRATEAAGGPPSILVNAAGLHLRKFAMDTSDDELASMMKIHAQGAFAMSRAVAGGMMHRQHGSILFITSVASSVAVPQSAAYAAAKSATLGLVRALAGELSPAAVRVNAIAPGWIDSDVTRTWMKTDRTASRRILQRTPMQRLGTPDDVGYAAVYLCSKAARFITGTILPVDGGAGIGF
jgi:NAD(P)-dependent dehydrogenase (short-subunit alcohol dehydrogenase family)